MNPGMLKASYKMGINRVKQVNNGISGILRKGFPIFLFLFSSLNINLGVL
ncbi:MAG: hypothetical protein FMNOHCHN_03177 [Ignavibacteriaceae bacterium]|nr:hypothetical protein [Ignavibacteriaceae bacterium]